MSTMNRQYITVGKTPREKISEKNPLKAEVYVFLSNFKKQNIYEQNK